MKTYLVALVLLVALTNANVFDSSIKVVNKIRAEYHLRPLHWDSSLALAAESIAKSCSAHPAVPKNTKATFGVSLAEKLNERNYYECSSHSCVGGDCASFLELMSEHNTNIGCGFSMCEEGETSVVCLYSQRATVAQRRVCPTLKRQQVVGTQVQLPPVGQFMPSVPFNQQPPPDVPNTPPSFVPNTPVDNTQQTPPPAVTPVDTPRPPQADTPQTPPQTPPTNAQFTCNADTFASSRPELLTNPSSIDRTKFTNKCVTPYKCNGKTYTGCTIDNISPDVPMKFSWCAIQVNATGDMSAWGICESPLCGVTAYKDMMDILNRITASATGSQTGGSSQTGQSTGNQVTGNQITGNQFTAQNTGNQFPPQNTGNQFPPQNTGNQFTAQNTGNQFTAQNTGNQFTGNQFTAQNTGNQFPPQNTGNQFPPQNTGNQFPPQNTNQVTGNQFTAQNTGNQFTAQNTNQVTGNQFTAQNTGNQFTGTPQTSTGNQFPPQNTGMTGQTPFTGAQNTGLTGQTPFTGAQNTGNTPGGNTGNNNVPQTGIFTGNMPPPNSGASTGNTGGSSGQGTFTPTGTQSTGNTPGGNTGTNNVPPGTGVFSTSIVPPPSGASTGNTPATGGAATFTPTGTQSTGNTPPGNTGTQTGGQTGQNTGVGENSAVNTGRTPPPNPQTSRGTGGASSTGADRTTTGGARPPPQTTTGALPRPARKCPICPVTNVECGGPNRGDCDKNTGECVCKNQWNGGACSKHPTQTYGTGGNSKCPICPYKKAECGGPTRGDCNRQNGACVCKNGWSGSSCSANKATGVSGYGPKPPPAPAPRGYLKCPICPYKKAECGSAERGKCDTTTGNCNCINGWSGPACANRGGKVNAAYGAAPAGQAKCPICPYKKEECGGAARGTCNRYSGQCQCKSGYKGGACSGYGYGAKAVSDNNAALADQTNASNSGPLPVVVGILGALVGVLVVVVIVLVVKLNQRREEKV